jgi:hypothetical protein
MWPIIIRELRIGSRRWTNYWLRLVAAAAVVMSIFFWFEATRLAFPQAGGVLFGHMHRTILATIWILVPLMMCDCLSRERPEGTLGLLFLTDLRAPSVLHAVTLNMTETTFPFFPNGKRPAGVRRWMFKFPTSPL